MNPLLKHCFTALVAVVALFYGVNPSTAAENQWSWIKGHNDPTTTGVYGELGIPAEENTPRGTGLPARWTTPDGDTWIYSGAGNANTMWRFDHATRNWAWMAGTSVTVSTQPVYGTKGEEAPTNTPGQRIKMATWTDNAGNLWLYGGVARQIFGDLWKFNTQTLQWTWVHGSTSGQQPAVYGNKGEASPDNTPGSRYGSASWIDEDGNFWLFGGKLEGGSDLWKYELASGQWVWVGGTPIAPGTPVYGIQGVPSTDNTPGNRSDAATWRDSEGNFWLFGGYGKTVESPTIPKRLNEVWKYSPASGEWTWVSGSELGDQPSVFGTRGVPHSSNHPGGRFNIAATIDHYGQVWTIGGTGGNNDLWCYNMERNIWTWVHGNLNESPYGVYGTKGVSAPENTPGVRYAYALWTDPQGNLMLFGAYSGFGATLQYNNGNLNDLWTLTPGQFSIPAAADDWLLYE